jgi:hypothetical protein
MLLASLPKKPSFCCQAAQDGVVNLLGLGADWGVLEPGRRQLELAAVGLG